MNSKAEKKEAVKLAVFNQKGGVGKTMTSVQLAGIFAYSGYKVLVVDCDPQSSATRCLLTENINLYFEENGSDPLAEWTNLYDLIDEPQKVNEAIIKSLVRIFDTSTPKWKGIDVIPSHLNLSRVQLEDHEAIKNVISSIRRTRTRRYDYDFIIFDMPPQINDFSIAVLTAAEYILVPAKIDKDSLYGYAELLRTVDQLHEMGINLKLEVIGVVMTMVSALNSFEREVYHDIKNTLDDKFINVPIRKSVVAEKSTYLGCPLAWLKRSDGVTQDYARLAETILRRCGMFGPEDHLDGFSDSHGSDILNRLT